MTDYGTFTAATARSDQPESHVERRDAERRFGPLWNGILHEFRNHLALLTAVGTELRSEIPPALALQVGEAMGETERNVQSLASLVALAEASVRTFDPVVADLDIVVERAIRLAAPAVGRRVSITAELGRKSGVKNRGAALESLLAALIIDLARASDGRGPDVPHSRHVRVRVDVYRRSLAIDIESDGTRPTPGSWRFLLACELAEKLEATITSPPEMPAYAVHFR